MSTGSITVDEKFAPELVEYWAQKYQEAKAALDQVQRSAQLQTDKNEPALDHSKLNDLIASLQSESDKRQALQDDLRQQLVTADKEKQELLRQIANAKVENAGLAQQLNTIFTQVAALANEADESRRHKIKNMFPPVSFVEPSFQPSVLSFINPQKIIDTLPSHFSSLNNIYFLPRPPRCMPLRIPACGQPGYWFYPSWSLNDTQFELLVEGHAGKWSYLGCYVSAAMAEGNMNLSEWMALDEQTKMAHCSRVANQGLQPGQTASLSVQLSVKRRYELGEWNVPCYSLRCVGFSMPLYQALHSAAAAVQVAHNPVNIAVESIAEASNSVSGKRRRPKDSATGDGGVELEAGSHKKGRGTLNEISVRQETRRRVDDKENS